MVGPRYPSFGLTLCLKALHDVLIFCDSSCTYPLHFTSSLLILVDSSVFAYEPVIFSLSSASDSHWFAFDALNIPCFPPQLCSVLGYQSWFLLLHISSGTFFSSYPIVNVLPFSRF